MSEQCERTSERTSEWPGVHSTGLFLTHWTHLRAHVGAVAESRVDAINDDAVCEELFMQVSGIGLHFRQGSGMACDLDGRAEVVIADAVAARFEKERENRGNMAWSLMKLSKLISWQYLNRHFDIMAIYW